MAKINIIAFSLALLALFAFVTFISENVTVSNTVTWIAKTTDIHWNESLPADKEDRTDIRLYLEKLLLQTENVRQLLLEVVPSLQHNCTKKGVSVQQKDTKDILTWEDQDIQFGQRDENAELQNELQRLPDHTQAGQKKPSEVLLESLHRIKGVLDRFEQKMEEWEGMGVHVANLEEILESVKGSMLSVRERMEKSAPEVHVAGKDDLKAILVRLEQRLNTDKTVTSVSPWSQPLGWLLDLGPTPRMSNCPIAPVSPGTLVWKARKGKYLIAICVYEQMANRMGCLQSTMMYAALLQRTMIMPSGDASARNYNFDLVLNVAHARECLTGNNNPIEAPPIITIGEYLVKHGGRLHIPKLHCWRRGCMLCVGRNNRCSGTLNMPKHPEVTFPSSDEIVRHPGLIKSDSVDNATFFAAFDVDDDFLVIGDVFNTRIRNAEHKDLKILKGDCKVVMQPHAAVVAAAKGFVETFLGPEFMAVHWRRGDFWGYCKGCFHSVPEVTGCLRSHAWRNNATVIYVATNAQKNEVQMLQALLAAPSLEFPRPLLLLKTPTLEDIRDAPWSEGLRQLDWEADGGLIWATFDILVCAFSKVFLASKKSTFSRQIDLLRHALGNKHCKDSPICREDAKLVKFDV